MKEWSTFIRENKVLHVPSMFKIDNGHLKKIDGEGDANQLFANYQKNNEVKRIKRQDKFPLLGNLSFL